MPHAEWTESDSIKAKQVWIEYQRQHHLAGRIGQSAGIDPHSGRIWFGESILDIVSQRAAEGLDSPLFFERVGSDSYYKKRRRSVGIGLVAFTHRFPPMAESIRNSLCLTDTCR